MSDFPSSHEDPLDAEPKNIFAVDMTS